MNAAAITVDANSQAMMSLGELQALLYLSMQGPARYNHDKGREIPAPAAQNRPVTNLDFHRVDAVA